jgi:hypothetical protein
MVINFYTYNKIFVYRMICTTGNKYIENHEIVGGARYVQHVNVSAVFSGRDFI